MGLSSCFFVASEAEARRNDGLPEAPDSHRTVFYEVMPTAIQAFVDAGPVKTSLLLDPIAQSDDPPAFTLRVPMAATRWLAACEDAQVPGLVTLWQNAAECPYADGAELAALVRALMRLAQVARNEGKALYLWNAVG